MFFFFFFVNSFIFLPFWQWRPWPEGWVGSSAREGKKSCWWGKKKTTKYIWMQCWRPLFGFYLCVCFQVFRKRKLGKKKKNPHRDHSRVSYVLAAFSNSLSGQPGGRKASRFTLGRHSAMAALTANRQPVRRQRATAGAQLTGQQRRQR